MTERDSERTPDVELRHTQYQLKVFEAISSAMKDPHGALEAVLGASDALAATRALQEQFGLEEFQAVAVMEVQFRRATATDREKIEQRRRELDERVRDLEAELRDH